MTDIDSKLEDRLARHARSWKRRPDEDNRFALGVLLAILLCGAVLNFANLSEQGLLHWDEADIMLGARYLLDGIQDPDALVAGRADGVPPFTGKPTHYVFTALATALLGDTPFAGQFGSAVFGWLTIPIVYLIGLVLSGGDRSTGLLSAAFLAFSPYHLMYSRMALADADATFFFQAGLLIYILTRIRNTRTQFGLFATGLLLGVSATTNYRYWPVVIAAGAILGIVTLQGSSWKIGRRVISGVGSLLVGIALSSVLWQIFFRLLLVYAQERHISMGLADYVTQVNSLIFGTQVNRFPQDLAGFLRAVDIGFYAKALFTFAGITFSLLTLASFMETVTSASVHLFHRKYAFPWGLDRPSSEYLYLALGFVVPIIIFTLYPFKALRFISVILPTCSFMAAVVLTRSIRLLGARRFIRTVVGFLIVAVLAESAAMDKEIVTWRSGFQAAMAYLKNQNVMRVLTTQLSITQYYNVNASEVRFVPSSESGLYEDLQDGYEYFLIDDLGYYSNFNAQLLRKIETQLSPVYVTADPFKQGPAFFLEQDPAGKTFDEALASIQALRSDRGAPQIRIYKLDSDFTALLPKPGALPAQLGQELLLNPSFEYSDNGTPLDWAQYGQPIMDNTGRIAHSGQVAVCTSRDDRSSGYFQKVATTPGAKYKLSEYVKSSSNRDESARVQINWVDSQNSIVGVSLEVVPALTDAWRQRSIVANAPSGSSAAVIYVSVHLTAQVCFDDFSFVQIEP